MNLLEQFVDSNNPALLASKELAQKDEMVKDDNTVIEEFNSLVNMSAPELRDWLQRGESQSSGWTRSDSSDTETVGHESGRKIVSILEHNPQKDPSLYESDDIPHMRKVVGYCKRHLAREETFKRNTQSKSYKSLKNWGHDALKE